MTLHGKIMNTPTTSEAENAEYSNRREAYMCGHRDARHAAAEFALSSDAAMEEAAKVIEELCRCYGHPTPDATLARLRSDA